MGKSTFDVVRDLCLDYPETEMSESRGSPTFRVRDKVFAYYTVNHHGDGRAALLLYAPSGAQAHFVEMDPDHYFVPPYVGPKGYLGVDVGKDLDWQSIGLRIREAWEHVAPEDLRFVVGKLGKVSPPTNPITLEDIDPFLKSATQKKMAKLDAICRALPEAVEGEQFGSPVWKAGKKTFVCAHHRRGRLALQFWCGAGEQDRLAALEGYVIPPYIGHRGWIERDVGGKVNWAEIEALALQSYRHFALKRMLKELDGA